MAMAAEASAAVASVWAQAVMLVTVEAVTTAVAATEKPQNIGCSRYNQPTCIAPPTARYSAHSTDGRSTQAALAAVEVGTVAGTAQAETALAVAVARRVPLQSVAATVAEVDCTGRA